MSLLLEMFDLVHGVETVLVEEDWLMSMRQDCLSVCLQFPETILLGVGIGCCCMLKDSPANSHTLDMSPT